MYLKENIFLASTPIEISEFPNHKEATFLISVLDEYNLNNVLIRKAEGEKYHKTIIGYPILAYLKYDKDGKPDDFGGHELRSKLNPSTGEIEYYFATFPIGSVTDAWIEKREVEGYVGEKDCILIKAKLWSSRFPEYFKVFDKLWERGFIASSWEISVFEAEQTPKGKILLNFEWIGNCLLGSTVKGAVKGAGVLDVASENKFNYELSNAILQDIKNGANDSKGVNDVPKNNTASVTVNDLYDKLWRAISSLHQEKYYVISMIYPYEYRFVAYDWDRESEEDFIEFTYSVNSDDTISITSQKAVKLRFVPVAEIDQKIAELEAKISENEKEIVEAGKSITELTKEKEQLLAQIEELKPYKEKVEEMEKAEMERQLAEKKEELKTFALEDELITSEELENSEELSAIFAELTLENYESAKEKIEVIKGRRAIQKYRESKQEKQEVEVSEVKNEKNVKPNLNNEKEGILSAVDIVKQMLGK